MEVLEARISLLERRLQLISDELSKALAPLEPGPKDIAASGDRAPAFSASVEFDADSLSQFAQGFYQREYDRGGKVFRWTGNGPLCELRFFLDRTDDRSFKMGVGTTPVGVLSQLTGFVDYAPVPLIIERNGAKRFVTGTVPKRAYTRLAVVTFLLGKMPPKKNKAAEDYWLGFRFYSFTAD